MTRYKRHLIPVGFQDIPAIETWLADLATEGLFLVSCGIYSAKFEAGEPAKCTYRLEAASNPIINVDPNEKKNTFFQEFGWEYVCTFGSYFHVYRSKLENPPEIHTDPKGQARAFARICCAQAFVALLYLCLLFQMLHSRTYSLFNIVSLGYPMVLGLTFWAASFFIYTAQFFQLYKTYRRLKNGTPLEHSADYRSWLPLRRLLRIAPSILFVLCIFSLYGSIFINGRADWVELPEAFPIVSLAEIERDDSLEIEINPSLQASSRQTFLAPEQITITQRCSVSGRNWADSSSVYAPSLTLEIYSLRFPSLAEPFLQSLMRDSTRFIAWDTEELEGYGAEEAYLCTNTKYPWQRKLFFRKGNIVIYADYRGEADLRPFLPEFAALAQADFSAIKP